MHRVHASFPQNVSRVDLDALASAITPTNLEIASWMLAAGQY
jgi:hypothetical protein